MPEQAKQRYVPALRMKKGELQGVLGLTEEVKAMTLPHWIVPPRIEREEELQQVLHLLESGQFNQFEPGIFDDFINSIKSPHDPWMTIADFRSFVDTQKRVEKAYRDKEHWTKMSILNCANSGKFSTDRTISEYNRDIWKLTPQPVKHK